MFAQESTIFLPNVFAIKTPVAIAIGVRYGNPQPQKPAKVRYTRITGSREEKLSKLDTIRTFDDVEWQDCLDGWMQPFLPKGKGDYYAWPPLTCLFPWQHSGVQFKRTWPIGETAELLKQRWAILLASPPSGRAALVRETGARRANAPYESFLSNHARLPAITEVPRNSPPLQPVRYAFRSFDRQWVLPDVRFCDRPRGALWFAHSDRQIYLTSILADVLGLGPAATITACIPDLHHFSGRGGKDVVPLYRDATAMQPNLPRDLLATLGRALGTKVTADDFFSYTYAILVTPAYVETFSEELTIPGPRLPITKNPALFVRTVELGRKLVWLHTYGERFVLPHRQAGHIPQGEARCRRGVPTEPEGYPETFSHDSTPQVLRVGKGVFSPVSDAVWQFSVSGLQVVQSWLKYRMKHGAGRSSSPLDEIRPTCWTAEMTKELLEMLWVLEATVTMFPNLRAVFGEIIGGETFCADEIPQPTSEEKRAPIGEEDQSTQVEIDLWNTANAP